MSFQKRRSSAPTSSASKKWPTPIAIFFSARSIHEPAGPISTRHRLEEHLRETGLADHVRIHPIAASSQAGEVELTHPQSAGTNHGMASIYKSLTGEGTTYRVPTARLDEMIEGTPDLIKIDVEGAELSVIEGMERILRSTNHPN